MNLSLFSFAMALIWFNGFISICRLISRKAGVLEYCGALPLVILILLGFIRLFVPIELPYGIVVRSGDMIPVIQDVLNGEIISVGGVSISLAFCVISYWLVKAAKCLHKFLQEERQGAKTVKSCELIEDERIQRIMQEVVKESKSKRQYTIVVASGLTTPLVTGYFNPVIHIPLYMLEFDDLRIEYILRHEWSHIAHRDMWVLWLVNVLCCLFWWNRPIYKFKDDIVKVVELNCDRRVVEAFKGPDRESRITGYLTSIFKVAHMCNGEKTYSGLAVHFAEDSDEEKAFIIQRCKLIANAPKTTLLRKIVFYTLAVILFFGSYSFIIQPYRDWPDVNENGWNDRSKEINKDTSYLLEIEGGRYHLYIDGTPIEEIDRDDLKYPPINKLPIIEKEERSVIP